MELSERYGQIVFPHEDLDLTHWWLSAVNGSIVTGLSNPN